MTPFASSLRQLAGAAALIASACLPSAAHAVPVVPGFTVSPYAVVPAHNRFTFGSDGTLYAGNTDNAAAGARLHRIGPGGGAASGFGPAIFDPDAVLFDASGAVSGAAGSVLVGGNALTAVRPDQSAVVLFSGSFNNVGDLAFDRSGRLLFTDNGNGDPDRRAVFAVDGGVLTRLFVEAAGAAPDAIAVDAANRIFTSRSDGAVSIHAADGSLLDAGFVTGLSASPVIDFGRGGAFGDHLYALDAVTGELWRIDAAGQRTLFGSGFSPNSTELSFGPDGALYIGDFDHDLILRVAAVPEPGSAALLLAGAVVLVLRRFSSQPAA